MIRQWCIAAPLPHLFGATLRKEHEDRAVDPCEIGEQQVRRRNRS